MDTSLPDKVALVTGGSRGLARGGWRGGGLSLSGSKTVMIGGPKALILSPPRLAD
jgi:hypothetical protein